ncbi:MAG: 1-(5-phosphoribosyl)-5-[(5-phosphoribosylamino)methylideneamino]imidazole-4-carboxamide isomerase [Rhodospirillales bacterium]|nr:1-(5-phosphoribosyl)-5-[(5-phosphoribosylamino)methylideneamino]imidazole-4-carboxamide isomerase [Rhodospirillales bacterium]
MILYPAIDLLDGQCVRLYKGDFAQVTTYGDDPVAVAQSYKDQGAEWLHLVDLSGAENPENRQIDLIEKIIAATDLKVQTGGGIRSEAEVRALLDAGAGRVVIGSLMVKDPLKTEELLQTYGADSITLAMDVVEQDDVWHIAAAGWQETSPWKLKDVLENYAAYGLKNVLCTDIARDGTMQGCNTELYRVMKLDFNFLEIQASGGVNSLDDLRAAKAAGAAGAIVGKALYEGVFTVGEALGVC